MALNRTIEKLDEDMGLEEFLRWKDFETLYDLPDAYLVAGQLGALINSIMGGRANPAHFAPYYGVDRKPDAVPVVNSGAVAASKAFVKSCIRPRRNHGPATK